MDKIINKLKETNCIKEGSFILRNGETSKYYFDMKNLVSHPELLSQIGDMIYLSFIKDKVISINNTTNNKIRICGVPLGGLPISTYISTKYNIPMIMLRDKVKKYGTQKQIEGEYDSNDYCIIIEDVVTTGGSIKESLEILKSQINVMSICVILNRSNISEIDNICVDSLLSQTDILKNRLKNIINNKNTRLCFSADLENPEKVIDILKKIGKYIAICKIHFDIFKFNEKYNKEKFKEDLINISHNDNFLLMEDRKFFDISYIVDKQYSYFKNWIDLVTVHGMINDEVLKKISCGVLLVSDMSNNNYDITDRCIELYKNNKNVIGLITQKNTKYKDLLKFTPGISTITNTIQDQKYRNIDNLKDDKPDIIIVGRSIYNSANVIEKVYELNTKFN